MDVTDFSFPYGEPIQSFSPADTVNIPDTPLKEWLLCPGSLTHKLKQHCDTFQVELLHQSHHTSVNTEPFWAREVLLYLDGIAWIYARTLIPHTLMQNPDAGLMQLGSQPLGELLFADNPFETGQLQLLHFRHNPSFADLCRQLQQTAPNSFWGRQRLFHYHHQSLCVTELFLPAAEQMICEAVSETFL